MNCPHCLHPCVKYDGVSSNKKHYMYICENANGCCDLAQRFPYRWMIGFSQDEGEVIFYQTWFLHHNKNYFIEASASSWTRLYYDVPDYGALTQAPILEIYTMLPLKEPYLYHVQKNLNKLLKLLIFT